MVVSKAEIISMLGDWASARSTLKEIKGYKDDELFSIAHIGYFFLMEGRSNEARTIFEGLIAINPRNDYYYRALGVIFHKLGEYERAIRQFSYAIRISPKSPHAYVNRAEMYLSQERHEQAGRDLKSALERMDYRDQRLSRKAYALLKVVTGQETVR